ncbi:MAG: CCA tRNA nucleotidyltransferase [Anaerolineales bacterium]
MAILRGQIIAQAATREKALLSARLLRPKEVPELMYMTDSLPIFSSPLLETIRAAWPAATPLHLVGGAPRDSLLGRDSHDLDFATPPGALSLARELANRLGAAYFPLDADNDTARVILPLENGRRAALDFAGYRGPDLPADLRDRDFTINAIALDVFSGETLDPLGGARDLREKRIRACSPNSLSDDPVRILRAVRQAAAFGFSIEAQTRQQMKEAVPGLTKISAERLRDELFKTLEGPAPDGALRALDLLGVLPYVLPELPALKDVTQSPPHVHDVWTHTLAVLRHLHAIIALLDPCYDEEKSNADLFSGLLVTRLGRYRAQLGEHFAAPLTPDRSVRALLFFAALYHDIEKPSTRSVEAGGRIRFFGHDEKGAATALRRAIALRLSNAELDRLKIIIRQHMRPHHFSSRKQAEAADPSPRAIYRFFRETDEAGVDVLLLSLADLRATYDHTLTQEVWSAALDTVRALLEAWYERPAEVIRPPQLLDGDDLQTEFKLPPGREIGQILEAVRENQAAGRIANRAEALLFARGWLEAARREK